jgi:c-di-AMP phosphodiesterase-like protein
MIIFLVPVSLFFLINSIILLFRKKWHISCINFLLSVVFVISYFSNAQSYSIQLLEEEISNLRSENLKLNVKILKGTERLSRD